MTRRIVPANMVVKCKACQTDVYKASFCSNCGEALFESELTQPCSKGHINRLHASFCSDCGESLPFWHHAQEVWAVLVLVNSDNERQRYRIHKRCRNFESAYDVGKLLRDTLPGSSIWVVHYLSQDNVSEDLALSVRGMWMIRGRNTTSKNLILPDRLFRLELVS
jgi:hypothetical protein